MYTLVGRDAIDLVPWELSESELEQITQFGPHDSDSSLPAFYHLYLFEVSLSCEMALTCLSGM